MQIQQHHTRFSGSGSFHPGRLAVFLLGALQLAGALFADTASAQPGSSTGNRVVLTIPYGPDNPRNSEGDFITLKTGRILYIYSHFTGSSRGDDGHAYLASRYSDDGGLSWSKNDQTVVEQEGNQNVMSVSVLRLKNGQIALFYLRKNSAKDCIPMMRISTDEAKTWSEPVKCITDKKGYFVLNNSRVMQLKDGRILMAVAQHTWTGGKFARMGRLYCYYSDDNGRTWRCSTEVANPDGVVTQEPGLVSLSDGRLVMYIRTNAHVQYFAYSSDRGETWSRAEPSQIASPLAPATIVNLPDHAGLLLVWNDNGKTEKRTPLNIAVSRDDGKTWTHEKVVADDPDVDYCYFAVHFVGKSLVLGYLISDKKGVTTVVRRLSLKWLLQ